MNVYDSRKQFETFTNHHRKQSRKSFKKVVCVERLKTYRLQVDNYCRKSLEFNIPYPFVEIRLNLAQNGLDLEGIQKLAMTFINRSCLRFRESQNCGNSSLRT